MLPCRDETIFCCWLSGHSPGKQVEGLADNPWIAISASPDHDRITTGLCKHGFNPVCIEQVAATNHRDSQGLLEGPDLLPFGLAAKHLRPGSRVQGEGVNTLFNGNPGNFHEVDRVAVPTGAELDGQRLARRFADCRDDPGNLAGSRSRALPAPERVTLRTGQPRFRSIKSAPSATDFAASAMRTGASPNN